MPQLDDALLFTIDLMAILDAHAEDIIGLGDEDTVVRCAPGPRGAPLDPHPDPLSRPAPPRCASGQEYLVEQGVEEHDAAAAIKLRHITGHRSHYTVDYRAEGRIMNELERAHEAGM